MTTVTQSFPLAERFGFELRRIGREGEPVLSVDDVLRSPDALVDYAAEAVEFKPAWGPHGGYPGLRAPAPLNYVETLVRALDPAIQRAFGLSHVKLARAECNFSVVVLGEHQLAPLQQIPHVDTTDPLQFALLHYLCEPEHGGTAFYRHRATAWETLTPERQPRYEALRERELAEQPAGYIRGDTAHYEQTAAFEARPNRLIIYRSRTLHSGQIPVDAPLDPDPRKGRLTANIFLNYRRLA
jgi:hypothetical protein